MGRLNRNEKKEKGTKQGREIYKTKEIYAALLLITSYSDNSSSTCDISVLTVLISRLVCAARYVYPLTSMHYTPTLLEREVSVDSIDLIDSRRISSFGFHSDRVHGSAWLITSLIQSKHYFITDACA
jgi:hypothetical protein